MSNGDMADPTTSGIVSSGTTPSNNRSLKVDEHSNKPNVKTDAIVECVRGDTDSFNGKGLSNLVVDLPSTSDTQSTNLHLNSTYWRPGCPFASKSKSSSSAGKRKAALPKKRPAALEEPVNISADTGEVEEDSTSAATEIVLDVDDSCPITRIGSKRLIAYRKKPTTNRLAKSTTSDVIDGEKSAVGTDVDCNLFSAFPLVETVGNVDGSANELASAGITDMGTEKKSSTRIEPIGGESMIASMPSRPGEHGTPSNCWTMQRCIGKGNTKREIDGKREEDLKDEMCIIMEPDRSEKLMPSTDESLRKEPSESNNKSAMSTSASTDVLNGLCGNSLADISGLLFNSSNSTAIGTAISNLLLGGTGGVTDMNALNALSAPDLLTAATAATGMLPFIGTNLAEFSADQQKMQMALIEAATAAANSTLCGLISEKAVGAERERSSVGSLKQASSIMPSTSSKQTGSTLLAPVIINGKESTHSIKGKTVGSSGQQMDSNSDGLSMGMSLPAVMPEMNGTQTVGELLDPLMSESKSTFGQRLVTTDDETVKGATQSITREDRIDLEELENFAQTFKKQRIKFGFTQGDVGMALGRRYGTDFSQTTISRFEALNLSFKNMCKLRPLLKEWLADAEAAIANGASASDLLEAQRNDSSMTQSGTPTGIQVAAMVNSATEGSPSPNGSCIGTPGIPLRKRRKRTNLDAAQRAALDGYFQLNPRPDHDRMAQIAGTLELDRDVVRVWFCNRRQKLRKE